ncbi:T9SS type A sorting domain-containing protein [Hyunsoonleella rubra]|uniref:T9SS type A sorting domain-containing protein n=1 Tax=Hyunsoonleella rubra TaxID=1737062 RepID=A0ABW5TBG4_9FLAO
MSLPIVVCISAGQETIDVGDLAKVYSPLSPPKAPKNTPFDNFFTNDITSQQHIQFTLENGNWLIEELDSDDDKGFFSCASSCSEVLEFEISGSSTICPPASKIYTISNISQSASVTWSISPASKFSLSASGTSVTVVPITTSLGVATLEATINTDCNDFITIEKSIWSGKPSFPKLITSSGVPLDEFNLPAGCADGNTYWKFETWNASDQTTQFEFNILGGPVVTKNVINGEATLTAQDLGMIKGLTYDVKVRPVNACGSHSLVPTIKLYNPTDCECGIGINCNLMRAAGNEDKYTIYPNPTNDYLTVLWTEEHSDLMTKKSRVTAVLLDMKGEKKKRFTINGVETTISVKGLPEGIYVLKINLGEAIESHLIAIN